jgi:hypothetical protein
MIRDSAVHHRTSCYVWAIADMNESTSTFVGHGKI